MKINSLNILLLLIIVLFASCNHKAGQVEEGVYYTCSMDPQIVQNRPGTCPICKMDLTRVEGTSVHSIGIKLSEDQIRLGNIKTEKVKADEIGKPLSFRAEVAANPNKVNIYSSRIPGRVERLYYKTENQHIKKGSRIFDVYSEEMESAIEEYFMLKEKAKTLKNGPVNYEQLLRTAKDKLLIWGLSEKQIDAISVEKGMAIIPFYSNITGTIDKVFINEGDYVSEGTDILQVSDYSELWVNAEVYPEDLNHFKLGMEVTVFIEGLSKGLAGKVVFEDPVIREGTRINEIKIAIINKDRKIKPGARATVAFAPEFRKAITIPYSSLLFHPSKTTVWIEEKDGEYVPRMVETGIVAKDKVEIISGLTEGEHVVVSGAYLLDSEFALRKGSSVESMHIH
ncbi:MAG TPA: efflux RND transporter periplasmic adaptor subunit [Cytophagaceae bacterium]